MVEIAQYYLAFAAMTAIYLIVDVPARKPGEWLALAGIALVWPAAFVYAVLCVIKRGQI